MNSPQVSISRPASKVEYVKATATPSTRLILCIDGPAKTGKTRFCLSAPGPIAVHNFDLGLEGVVETYLKEHPEKEIYPFQYQIPLSARLPGMASLPIAEKSAAIWERFVVNFVDSLTAMRTVVVDTGSEMWNLVRLARLGKLTQVLPIQYTAVNAEFRQLTQLALANTKANVIYTHRVKPVYKNEQKTEETERAGFGEIEYDVQTVLRADRDYAKAGAEQFGIRVEECRSNIRATGAELRAGDCTFQKVAALIYPETTEEFWLN